MAKYRIRECYNVALADDNYDIKANYESCRYYVVEVKKFLFWRKVTSLRYISLEMAKNALKDYKDMLALKSSRIAFEKAVNSIYPKTVYEE